LREKNKKCEDTRESDRWMKIKATKKRAPGVVPVFKLIGGGGESGEDKHRRGGGGGIG